MNNLKRWQPVEHLLVIYKEGEGQKVPWTIEFAIRLISHLRAYVSTLAPHSGTQKSICDGNDVSNGVDAFREVKGQSTFEQNFATSALNLEEEDDEAHNDDDDDIGEDEIPDPPIPQARAPAPPNPRGHAPRVYASPMYPPPQQIPTWPPLAYELA